MDAATPITYRVRLEPDLARFSFSGTLVVTLESEKPRSQVSLNVLDIAVWQCALKTTGQPRLCAFRLDPGSEELIIELPEPCQGRFELEIEFQGRINDLMAGFYRSRYQFEGKSGLIAVTQFQESDARRAFPCMDHPVQKAVFELELVVDKNLTAVSNTPVARQEPVEGNKKRVCFEPTPIMSSYLVFLGVGDFSIIKDPVDSRVRGVMLPGMDPYVSFGLEFGRKALKFSEQYYDIPYPLAKMDLIAVPDFAFGAMENWGAITFRENLLLYDPDLTSGAGQERICEVIAHEIAHQWFGNLVTPSDWKYIWLNESFATYFGFGVVAQYYPQWQTWDQFLFGQTETAMQRDSLHETQAIEIPGGEHVVINASTAPIIYSKGGSMLRQIHGYIGEDHFRKGLTAYLKKYAYSCAASQDLWETLEEVSRKPVTKLMKTWVEQPGFPVVEVAREGGSLMLTQKRFTYLPRSDADLWPIPITLTLFDPSGNQSTMELLFEQRCQKLDIAQDTVAYKLNNDQTGFYRVRYLTGADLDALGRLIADKSISPKDRWGVQNDLWAMVKGGVATHEDFLEFLQYYQKEDGFLPLAGIAANLFQSFLVLHGDSRAQVMAAGKGHARRVLSMVGHTPKSDEPHPAATLRDQILWHAAQYKVEPALAFLSDQFERLTQERRIHRDILKSVLQGGALIVGQKALDWMIKRLETTHSEHERMNILTAMGCFQDPGLIEQSLDYVLDKVPNRNKFIPIVSAAANPHLGSLLWKWYRAHLDEVEKFHPILYERVIAGIVPVSAMGDQEEAKAFFESYLERNPAVTDVVKLSLERLEINLRMRRRPFFNVSAD